MNSVEIPVIHTGGEFTLCSTNLLALVQKIFSLCDGHLSPGVWNSKNSASASFLAQSTSLWNHYKYFQHG